MLAYNEAMEVSFNNSVANLRNYPENWVFYKNLFIILFCQRQFGHSTHILVIGGHFRLRSVIKFGRKFKYLSF